MTGRIGLEGIPPDGSSGTPDRDEVREMLAPVYERLDDLVRKIAQEEVERFVKIVAHYSVSSVAPSDMAIALEAYREGRNAL